MKQIRVAELWNQQTLPLQMRKQIKGKQMALRPESCNQYPSARNRK